MLWVCCFSTWIYVSSLGAGYLTCWGHRARVAGRHVMFVETTAVGHMQGLVKVANSVVGMVTLAFRTFTGLPSPPDLPGKARPHMDHDRRSCSPCNWAAANRGGNFLRVRCQRSFYSFLLCVRHVRRCQSVYIKWIKWFFDRLTCRAE